MVIFNPANGDKKWRNLLKMKTLWRLKYIKKVKLFFKNLNIIKQIFLLMLMLPKKKAKLENQTLLKRCLVFQFGQSKLKGKKQDRFFAAVRCDP